MSSIPKVSICLTRCGARKSVRNFAICNHFIFVAMSERENNRKRSIDLCMDKILDDKMIEVELRPDEMEHETFQLLEPSGSETTIHYDFVEVKEMKSYGNNIIKLTF